MILVLAATAALAVALLSAPVIAEAIADGTWKTQQDQNCGIEFKYPPSYVLEGSGARDSCELWITIGVREARRLRGLIYGARIKPVTFNALLNGDNISGRFTPEPEGYQIVRLPLAPGVNTLVLSVEGITAGDQTVTDTHRLIFGSSSLAVRAVTVPRPSIRLSRRPSIAPGQDPSGRS